MWEVNISEVSTQRLWFEINEKNGSLGRAINMAMREDNIDEKIAILRIVITSCIKNSSISWGKNQVNNFTKILTELARRFSHDQDYRISLSSLFQEYETYISTTRFRNYKTSVRGNISSILSSMQSERYNSSWSRIDGRGFYWWYAG